MRLSTLVSTAVLSLTIAAPLAAANSVTGSMTVNGKKTEFHHVIAVASPGMFHENRKDLVIVLSDEPVAASDVEGSTLTKRWMDGKLSAILLRIQPWDKQMISGNLWAGNLAKEGRQISGNGFADFLPSKFDATHVDAHLVQKKYGDKELWMSMDATISAAIEGGKLDFTSPEPQHEMPVEKKLDGKPLPSGGGDPGAAFNAFLKAVHGNQGDAAKKLLAQDLQKNAGNMKDFLPMFQELIPKDTKVLGGISDGNNAELDITSKANGKGMVKMVREKDGWKFRG